MPEDLRISMDMPPDVCMYSASRFILYCVWIIG